MLMIAREYIQPLPPGIANDDVTAARRKIWLS